MAWRSTPTRASKAIPRRRPAVPIERHNGWLILHLPEFETRFVALAEEVEELRARLSVPEYRQHPTVKLFASIIRLIREVIPSDPNAPRFRLTGALRTFRRAKNLGMPPRYRLFWVFSERHRTIVFLYLNDKTTLRKDGSSTDPYEVFGRLVARGEIGADFASNLHAWRANYPDEEVPS